MNINLSINFRLRLSAFANQCLEPQHLKPLLKIDTQVNIHEINQDLFQQLNILHPCGIDNSDPIFWTANVQVIEQKIVGKGHIKLTVSQTIDNQRQEIKGIAWRWGDYFPLPSRLDIAYKLRENNFNGKTTIEMELIGAKLPNHVLELFTNSSNQSRGSFEYKQRQYTCGIYENGVSRELRVKNSEGKVLVMQPEDKFGLLGFNRDNAEQIDLSQPIYEGIIQTAIQALSTSVQN